MTGDQSQDYDDNAVPCNTPLPRHQASVEGFLEELVVRRELADNYCHYCPGATRDYHVHAFQHKTCVFEKLWEAGNFFKTVAGCGGGAGRQQLPPLPR